MGKIKSPSFFLVLTVLICISITAGLVSAASQITSNNNIYLKVANDNGARFDIYGDDTYHFFSTTQLPYTGLNSNHISSSINKIEGDVTKTNSTSGTFYFTDTDSRGWVDNGILMIAVNGTLPENFSIQINSAGYQWTPISSGYPNYSSTIYNTNALSEIFTQSDFSSSNGYYSHWKPCTASDYPIYEDQDVAEDMERGNVFNIIFVDLNAGIIGPNTLASTSWLGQTVYNNGALQIDYTINNLPAGSMVAFNSYAFCNSSKQGQGIRWTNSVNIVGNNSNTTSGWRIASWF